jgi:hypothetical protein
VFKRAHHWSLSWASCNQFTHSHPIFPKIHSNVVFPSTPLSSELPVSLKISNQNFVCISHTSYACYMLPPSYPSSFDYSRGESHKLLMKTGTHKLM